MPEITGGTGGTGGTAETSGTGVFLQVRLDSSRLPRKALLMLEGKAVIAHAMEALKAVEADVYALLTDRESTASLFPFAEACGFEVFTGPRDDVLERYALAAEFFGVSTIIRATGDNPLVSGECAQMLLGLHRQREADYSGFRGLPLGTGVECVRTAALLTARRQTRNEYDREHVCPFLYNNHDMFTIYRPQAPPQCYGPQLRVTLDTREDFERLRMIYRELYRGGPIPTATLVSELPHSIFAAG
jgi:spore coat polysaccharide biosynthesis protein SpsF